MGLVAAPWLALVAGAEETSRPDIVDRAIRFHGGDLYESTATSLELCSKSGCFHVRASLAATDGGVEYDFDVRGATREGERRVRSTHASVELWLDGAAQTIPAGDAQRYRDWAMARVYFCFLPYRLADPGVHHTDQGTEQWGERTLHRVKVTFAEGSSTDADDEYVYWFDPETGRVEQFAYSYATNGGGLRFRRAFDHRRVGGILFFDQENLGVEGPDLSVDQIDSEFVEQGMRSISTVELRNIRVEPTDQ